MGTSAIVLVGAATAAAGPIVFIGLTIPHLARAITGPDYRWVLPYSAVLAPVLLLGSDIIGRIVARPAELQVGIVTALIGGPFFVILAVAESWPNCEHGGAKSEHLAINASSA